MDRIQIRGGVPLHGAIPISGAKNAALPLMIASLLTDDGLRTDVREAEQAIEAAAGMDPRPWFRCRFGDGHDDARVLGALEELGYRNVHWHVELEDWERWRDGDAIADVREHDRVVADRVV